MEGAGEAGRARGPPILACAVRFHPAAVQLWRTIVAPLHLIDAYMRASEFIGPPGPGASESARLLPPVSLVYTLVTPPPENWPNIPSKTDNPVLFLLSTQSSTRTFFSVGSRF